MGISRAVSVFFSSGDASNPFFPCLGVQVLGTPSFCVRRTEWEAEDRMVGGQKALFLVLSF